MLPFVENIYASESFLSFTAKDCNRLSFINNFLKENALHGRVLEVSGAHHIYVSFPNAAYNPMFKQKLILAHYDRAGGSYGANDNSSSVFALLHFAVRLKAEHNFHNIRIIFTDKEEGEGTSSVCNQGSFPVAQAIKRLFLAGDIEVYVFDSTGRGSVAVIGAFDFPEGADERMKREYEALKSKCISLVKSVTGKYMELPVGFSDNASFMAHGIPSVLITMLPDEEVHSYLRALQKVEPLRDFVMNHNVGKGYTRESLFALLPETWKFFHTDADAPASLEKRSFKLISLILDKLAARKTLCT